MCGMDHECPQSIDFLDFEGNFELEAIGFPGCICGLETLSYGQGFFVSSTLKSSEVET
jgi:hypothetical protein